MSIDILTNGITFTFSYSIRAFKRRKNVLTCLEKYVNQIDTRRYGDYTITDHLFCKDVPIKIASDMRGICDHIYQRHHKQTRNILIPLCKNYTEIYHFNILRIITIIDHIYIECELYNMAYTKKKDYFCWTGICKFNNG